MQGSIIEGFHVPLLQENKDLLIKGLLPLHKVATMPKFAASLQACVAAYVAKDKKLLSSCVLALLRWWPVSSPTKEVQFVTQLDALMVLAQEQDANPLELIQDRLASRLASCLTGANYEVSVRAAKILELLGSSFLKERKDLHLILICALESTAAHCNKEVRTIGAALLASMKEVAGVSPMSTARREEEALREARWNALERLHEEERQGRVESGAVTLPFWWVRVLQEVLPEQLRCCTSR